MFHGPAQGSVAPGDQPDHPVERNAVGRGQFRSVGDAQPAARPGADVEHPPAAPHAFDDAFDELFHDGDGYPHGFVYAGVFAVDARQDVVH